MLINTVTQYQEFHYISIVATCVGVSKIGSKLRPARGAQFFRTVLQIPNLEKVYWNDSKLLWIIVKTCVISEKNRSFIYVGKEAYCILCVYLYIVLNLILQNLIFNSCYFYTIRSIQFRSSFEKGSREEYKMHQLYLLFCLCFPTSFLCAISILFIGAFLD